MHPVLIQQLAQARQQELTRRPVRQPRVHLDERLGWFMVIVGLRLALHAGRRPWRRRAGQLTTWTTVWSGDHA